MIRQNDTLMPEAVKNWGCYFMSVLYLAEEKRKRPFYADEIISIYKSCLTTGIIDKEVFKDGQLIDGCYVLDPVSLFHVAGVRVSSVVKVDAGYKAGPGEYEILCYHRPASATNREHTHFVAGLDGKVAFDPLGNSNTVKYGYLKSKRIFK